MNESVNLLRKVMDERGMKQSQLLRALEKNGVETTKQTVFKLYHGLIAISPEWAAAFEPIFNLPWTQFVAPKVKGGLDSLISGPEGSLNIDPEIVRDLLNSAENRKFFGLWLEMEIPEKEATLEIMDAVSRLSRRKVG